MAVLIVDSSDELSYLGGSCTLALVSVDLLTLRLHKLDSFASLGCVSRVGLQFDLQDSGGLEIS